MNGAIPATGESLAKAFEIQSLQSRLPFIDTSKENDLPVVVEEIDDLLIQAFIEVITVDVLQITDCLNVRRLVCYSFQFRNLRFQRCNFAVLSGHLGLNSEAEMVF
jgi:hypothetical protein